MFDFLPKAYCMVHGKMVNTIGDHRFHLIPEQAFAMCEGPFAMVEPPVLTDEEWAFLIQEANEQTPDEEE